MQNSRWLLFLPLLLLAGCFPIELGVSPDGKVIISRQEGFFLFDPVTGKTARFGKKWTGEPVFARFSPDGKQVLAIVKNGSIGIRDAFEFHVAPRSGGKAKLLFKTGNAAYVRYSPDGKQLAVVRIAEKKKPPLKDALPELLTVSLDGGGERVVGHNVSHLCRWFSDSKRLLTLQVGLKDESSNFHGSIVVIDAATGKAEKLAAVKTQKEHYFDLSPDNKRVLFTALRAGKVGTTFPKKGDYGMKLFELEIATGKVRAIGKKADYAIYSPDGKHVLIGTETDGFDFSALKLVIADAGLREFKTVVDKAYKAFSLGGGIVYPGWIGNRQIYYFVQRKVYGTEGKGLYLTLVNTDGSGRKCVQPLIDAVAVNAE